jgi:hypothetical protein
MIQPLKNAVITWLMELAPLCVSTISSDLQCNMFNNLFPQLQVLLQVLLVAHVLANMYVNLSPSYRF